MAMAHADWDPNWDSVDWLSESWMTLTDSVNLTLWALSLTSVSPVSVTDMRQSESETVNSASALGLVHRFNSLLVA